MFYLHYSYLYIRNIRFDGGRENKQTRIFKERIDLLKELAAQYKEDYQDEIGTGRGRFISTTRPDIAGGDV